MASGEQPVGVRLRPIFVSPGCNRASSSLLKKGFCPGEDASLIRGTSLRRQIDSRRRAVGFFSFKPFENDGVFQQTARRHWREPDAAPATARPCAPRNRRWRSHERTATTRPSRSLRCGASDPGSGRTVAPIVGRKRAAIMTDSKAVMDVKWMPGQAASSIRCAPSTIWSLLFRVDLRKSRSESEGA
jgi:hypothetical protein